MICQRCKTECKKTGNSQKYCRDCGEEVNRVTARKWWWDNREKAMKQHAEWRLVRKWK